METPCIVWIRNDLRLHDNPALLAAAKTGKPVIICFIWSEDDQEPYPLGGASRGWLHDSLLKFALSLNNRLILRKGKYLDSLLALIHQTKATAVFWNRRYEPHFIAKDKEIRTTLIEAGVTVETFVGNVLFEPWQAATKTGNPYQVFTPFYKSLARFEPASCVEEPKELRLYTGKVDSELLSGLALLRRNPPLDIWQPGEKGALKALDCFLKGKVEAYSYERDFPSLDGTSKLSAPLHFGEISVRHIAKSLSGPDSEPFYRQLIWRDFATHLLFYFPHTPREPLKKEFANFPWRVDPEQLECWQKGRTGYPIVDAGMRELLATGWMHNRVRMIVGSFLVKHLLLSWRQGEAWFWEKLFDADLANNTLGWQWVGGSGADAAPYFRIFNPVLQGKKFDAEGDYIKHWVPELRDVDVKNIHTPWLTHVRGYVPPVVELDFGRMRALEAYQEMKNGKEEL